MSASDLKALKSAIDAITAEKGNVYVAEHDVLSELKQEMVDYEEDLGEMKEVAEISGRKNLRQTKGAARLFKKMQNILSKADSIASKLEVREETLRGNMDQLGKVGESFEDQEEHLITVQDLLGAVRGLQADNSVKDLKECLKEKEVNFRVIFNLKSKFVIQGNTC